ncbi:MAG: hypothetical protein ACREQ5_01415 [Candidatus Dormibacteria bacterium]
MTPPSKRPSLLPPTALAAVVTAIYQDAEDAGWDTLRPADRSSAYDEWVEDPRVGGILTRYMTPEQARSWIKDGPMKEYSRANRGMGRYAEFGRTGGTEPADIVRSALSPGAVIVPGSQRVKPFHCLADTDDGARVYVVWGEARNFRNLLWAALNVSVHDGLDAHIVVTEPPGRVTPTSEATTQRALADRCGLQLHHMRETFGARRTGGRS